MTQEQLKLRTKDFALRILRLADAVPQTKAGAVIARQIIRSGTSVAANYRAACRAKSSKDFLNKIIIVEEEADETLFWIELLIESGLMRRDATEALLQEANELVAIFTAAGRTTRAHLNINTNKTRPAEDMRLPSNTERKNPKSPIRNPKS